VCGTLRIWWLFVCNQGITAYAGFFWPNFWQPRPTWVAGFEWVFWKIPLVFWKIPWVFGKFHEFLGIFLGIFGATGFLNREIAYFGAKNDFLNDLFYPIFTTSIAGFLSFSWNFSLSFFENSLSLSFFGLEFFWKRPKKSLIYAMRWQGKQKNNELVWLSLLWGVTFSTCPWHW